ncbi:YhbD family protein [Candidatus Bipolaricaulota bacterium]|nr:YhbD family protein [Candidatus Bipolaricaulota bacterium]
MEDEHLISKKDVLEKMGISYGQLYRWKRKGLIPEVWFIRRSTFTGQETFFPEDKIVERIERIKNMKGEHALDDLADVISEHVNAKIQIAFGKLKHLGWFDEDLGKAAGIVIVENEDGTLSLRDALRLAVLKKLRRSARSEEIDLASRTLDGVIGKEDIDPSVVDGKTLYLLRKQLSGGGISAEISVIIISGGEIIVDPELRRIDSVDLAGMLQQVKLDLAACCAPGQTTKKSSVNQEEGRNEHE